MQAQMNPDLAQALQSVVTRLAGRYRGMLSEETVANTVRNAYLRLNRGATVRSMFMPALAERFARDQLRAAAQAEGLIPKDVPEVLFVCVRNAGRSQMAAAIAHHLSKGRVGVRSAGSEPGGAIHPTRNHRSDVGDRLGCDRGVPQAADRCRRPRGGRRGHDGLRRRLPGVPRQALRGLARCRSVAATP